MKTVVISVKDGMADVWARQFIDVFEKRPAKVKVEMGGTVEGPVMPRAGVMMTSNTTADAAIAVIKSAVKLAGENGTLVFNVGHGVAGDSDADGTVDLAPNTALRLGGLNNSQDPKVFVPVFYDFDLDGKGPRISDKSNDEKYNQSSPKLKRWVKYQELCKVIKDGKLRKVIFLTCKVGKSTDFIKKIAIDFNVIVEAYKRRVQLTPQVSKRVRIHLEGDMAGNGTNVPASEEHLFSTVVPRSSDIVLVGPPA